MTEYTEVPKTPRIGDILVLEKIDEDGNKIVHKFRFEPQGWVPVNEENL